MMNTRHLLCASAAAAAALLASTATFAAQPADDSLRTTSPSGGTPAHADVSAAVMNMMTGSFVTEGGRGGEAGEGEGDESPPALYFHGAPVEINGLDNSLYFEIHRADDPANPFRQGVLSVMNIRGELRLRAFDFATEPGFAGAITSLWAAPEAFPRIDADVLRPHMDLALSRQRDGYYAETKQPFPSTLRGAVEKTSRMTITSRGIVIEDRGYDAEGNEVWGPEGVDSYMFRRTEPNVTVHRDDDGLVIIDIVEAPPENPRAIDGASAALHFTSWVLETGYKFDDSRIRGTPVEARLPVRAIEGMNRGLEGLADGLRRRIIIPPALGYGDEGNPRMGIPGDSTIVFDVECVWLQNPDPIEEPDEGPAETPPDGPADGQAAGG